jgi:hypothetical protein
VVYRAICFVSFIRFPQTNAGAVCQASSLGELDEAIQCCPTPCSLSAVRCKPRVRISALVRCSQSDMVLFARRSDRARARVLGRCLSFFPSLFVCCRGEVSRAAAAESEDQVQCRAALEGVLFGGLVVGPVERESWLVDVSQIISRSRDSFQSTLPCVLLFFSDHANSLAALRRAWFVLLAFFDCCL